MTSKTVLITGAAHRIGAAIARNLHDDNMDVIIHYYQSRAAAEELVADLNSKRGNSAHLIQGDLLEFESYSNIIEQAYEFRSRLDVLVNNASSFFPTPFGQITAAQWQNLIGVNMQAPLFLAQHAAEYLSASNGCIINLTDIHALRPLKNHAVYSTAKAGLVMLTKAMAKEL
ncbi:MAG: pteridine reductase, partial [Gammaproteobacteria bacterium]